MKLMKRALALLLCFLMLTNGLISAFATEGVSDNDVVETTTTTETDEVCEECGGSDAHTDACSFNTINVYTEGEESIILDFLPAGLIAESESMTDTTAVITANPVTLYKSLDNGAEGIEVAVESDTIIDLITKYTFAISDTETLVFYRYDYCGINEALNDAALSEYSGYVFVYADDISIKGTDDTGDSGSTDTPVETEKTDAATGVVVSAELPEDVTLSVTPMTAASSGLDTTTYPITGASLFYDITLLQNSEEYQPENGITITFPESAVMDSGLMAGDKYNVYHIHDGVTDVTGPIQYNGGAIEVKFGSLSVVGVASYTNIDLTTVYGAYQTSESYSGYAVINSDSIRVYGAVDSDDTDYIDYTGVHGIAIELVNTMAVYEKGNLYYYTYSGDEDLQSGYFIPGEYITITCCYNCTGAAGCTCGCETCTCAEEEVDTTPIVGTRTTTVNGINITVEGSMISGATLFASVYTVTDPGAFGLADTLNVKAAYDIKLLDADGNAIQPDGSVFVTMDATAMGLSDGAVVEVIHQHGSTVETSNHIVINGKLIFPASGFSVFIVNSTTDTTGTEITGNSADNPYVMTVGESKIFFDSYGGGASSYTAETERSVRQMYNSNTTYYYLVDGTYKEVSITRTGNGDNRRYTISYADGSSTIESNLSGNTQPSGTYYYQASGSTAYRGEWQVTDESNAISYEITSVDYNGDNDWQHMAPYIEVTAKDVGLVTLTYKYVSGGSVHEETLYISVVAPNAELYVDDQVAENGCLVPVGLEGVEGVTYTWNRSDGQVIRSEALNADGAVNVSLDRGGLTEGRNPITYTVTATLANGTTTYTASYEVLYSNEILNPSFENTPVEDGLTNQYFYNGYPELYWKTTTPGSSTSQLTQDIEIITEKGSPAGSYGSNVTQASHGEQFAEINAEGFGALYQDILTTPGATLNWSFAHMARTNPSDSENTMYVVVAATEYAQSIIDFDDIDDLLDAARDSSIPSSGTGASFTYNGGTYYIWKHVGTNNWETISGNYVVPNDQYLTRLFFVSETANAVSVNETCGNLIDATHAGETMRYKIEYYVDGELKSDNTQTGNATVYTTVDLAHLQDYIDDEYVLTSARLGLESGAKDYPGDVTDGLFITNYGTSKDVNYAVVLKVYLAKRAVTITKNIVIDGWADMTDAEKDALIGDGLTARFALVSETTTCYYAELTIIAVSSTGALTAIGEFVDSNGQAPENGSYTVSEVEVPTVSGYTLTGTTFDVTTITITDQSPTQAVVCTNAYSKLAPQMADLTITKSGAELIDENQSFIFTVTGPNGFSIDVVIHGNSSVTIKDLPIGEYTVTENTDWSWRYTPEDRAKEKGITLTANGENRVDFSNKREKVLWLSGDCYVENWFTDGGIKKRDGSDDESE